MRCIEMHNTTCFIKAVDWLTLTWDVLKCAAATSFWRLALININMRCIEMMES